MTKQETQAGDELFLELLSTHDQFYKRVAQNYPELTDYELRLCVLLRANLSTKKIAAILDIAPDSVKKAKHRLRKKLALAPSDNWKL